MFTPKPESPAPAPVGGLGDIGSPDTDLISRLARELWQEISPSLASSAAGGATPASLAAPAASNGLAGAYPAHTPDYAPPVHPATESSTPAAPGGASSGAAGASGSHPFGEPHCRAFDQPGQSPATPASAHAPVFAPVGAQGFTTPAYYFIREPAHASVHPSGLAGGSLPTALPGLDVAALRRDFPALHQRVNGRPLIWLDNAATTQKPQVVIDTLAHYYSKDNSNIHRGAHTLAARSTDAYEGGREKIRRFLGAGSAREIVLARGTTELINLVAQTYGRKFIGAGDEIILTTLEHHANIVPWQLLAEQVGAVIRVVPINDRGELLLDQFAGMLNSRTKLVGVVHVANALGTINPIEAIIPLAHAHGVPVLVDAAQSTPHIPINVQALDVDFLVFSGHKVFGPTGVGALYAKACWLEQLPPWQGGGNMIADVTFAKTKYQDYPQRFEAGTQSIADVIGLGAALDYLQAVGLPAIAAYEHSLLEYATHALERIPGLRLIGTAAHKASVLSFTLPGYSSDEIGKHLDKHGIAVRASHHCAQPSLRRFGLETTVRPSLAFYNTHGEVDTLADAIGQLPARK
jgi:cysteine desulfurase/selenocysteine lyase